MKLNIIIFVVFASVIAVYNSAFILTEGKQAIVTEFGKPIGKPIKSAGLHFKVPFTQDVRLVDKRILSWDGFPNQIPTKDKKYIKVDTTARWQIVDVLKFIQTVQNERGAKARLDTILDGHTRDVISNHNLVEAVRNSNQILDADQENRLNDKDFTESTSMEIERIEKGRDKLSQMIVEKADEELKALGIKIIDVQLRRISYEESVERKVYERMISERQRVAQKIRSIGKGEKAEIEGRLDKDLKEIQSLAYKESKLIRGQAQAKASAIYAKSLRKAPKFYEFLRSMEAYKKSLKSDSKLILSSESSFLKHLK